MKKTALSIAIIIVTFCGNTLWANNLKGSTTITLNSTQTVQQSPEKTLPLNNKELNSAIAYTLNSGYFNPFSFTWLLDESSLVPYFLELEIDEDDTKIGAEIIPIEDRKISTSTLDMSQIGAKECVKMFEYLSSNRYGLNFEQLYINYRPIIKKVLSKEQYKEIFSTTVDMLLVAYDDIWENDPEYYQISSLMSMNWDLLYSSWIITDQMYDSDDQGEYQEDDSDNQDEQYQGDEEFINLDDYQNLIVDFIQVKDQLFTDKIVDSQWDSSKWGTYPVLWAYSFWLRRDNEGKTQEIYNALKAVQKDYK